MYYRIIDEPERRGYLILEEGKDGEDDTVLVESVVTNSINFLSLEEVEGNAQDAMQQLQEQAEMREAAALGLENEKHDPKWNTDAGAE